LSGIFEHYSDFSPPSNNVYYNSAFGVSPVVDLSTLVSYSDTLLNPNTNVRPIINSAILEITNILDVSEKMQPPNGIELLLTDITNKEQKIDVSYPSTRTVFDSLQNKYVTVPDTVIRFTSAKVYSNISSDSASIKLYFGSQGVNPVVLEYQSDGNKYVADITYFIQDLFDQKAEFTRLKLGYKDYSEGFVNDINGFSFNKNDIKIRLYYTQPK